MSSFTHVAILGRQPELGLMELESRLGADAIAPFGRQAAVLSHAPDIGDLGSVIKLAQILYDGPLVSMRQLPIDVAALPRRTTKTPYGLSGYGVKGSARDLMAAGLELKRALRESGSVRLIMPARGLALSAAELRHNLVLEQGFELVIVVAGPRMIVGKTLHVQDVDWYSRRDYGRPARSATVGMLPPKLAQVLVNSVAREAIVVDPFCGTGVVLQEALLMGRPTAGSDLSAEMVTASRLNLKWLASVVARELPSWQVELQDAKSGKIPVGAAIVSEGYLGPNLLEQPTDSQLRQIKRELSDLYYQILVNWGRQLPAGAEISLCVPAWRVKGGWSYLDLVDRLGELGYTLKGFKHVRTPLLYARENQVVGRQLLLLRKT